MEAARWQLRRWRRAVLALAFHGWQACVRYRAELAADRGSHALVVQLPAQLAAHLAAHIDLDPHLGPYLGPRQPAELAADLPAGGRDLPGELAAAAPAEPCVTGLAAPPPMSEAAAMEAAAMVAATTEAAALGLAWQSRTYVRTAYAYAYAS